MLPAAVSISSPPKRRLMQVVKVVAEQLLDAMEGMRGMADSHSWVAEVPEPAQVTLHGLTQGLLSFVSHAPECSQVPTQRPCPICAYFSAEARAKACVPQEQLQGRPAVVDVPALQAELESLVQGYLQGPVDAQQPLAAQGMDSLALMELRQKLQVQIMPMLFTIAQGCSK